MRDEEHGAIGVEREPAQEADELAHLRSVVLVADEEIGGGIKRDHDRADGEGVLAQAAEERRRSDIAGAVGCTERSVAADEAHRVQAASFEVREARAEVIGDCGKAVMQLALVVLGVDVDRRSDRGQAADPLAPNDGGDAKLHRQQ